LSVSHSTKKAISPEKELNFPELTSNEPLSVQTETVRLSGQTAINSFEKLLALATKLTAEFTQLKSDNAVLKFQICEPQDLLPTKSYHMEAATATLSSKPGVMSYKDALASNQNQQTRTANASKRSRNLISSIQKPTAANAVVEIPVRKNGLCLLNYIIW
jgi:hypothetical protein